MNTVDALDLVQFAMWTVFITSIPAVLPAMIIGIIIALFQALTQIQEVTLTFVPKIMIVFMSAALFANFMGGQLNGFVTVVFDRIVTGF